MDNEKDYLQQGLKQLAEKQVEEMDQMLTKAGLLPPVHTDDQVRASTFSELFSGLPVTDEEQD